MDEKQILHDAQAYVSLLQTDGVNIRVDEDVDAYTMQLPEWYDEKLFKRAQKFYEKNLFTIFAGKLCGLLAVLAVPSILKILIHTNHSSTPLAAYKRYMQTVFHTITWYENDLTPGSKTWKSLEAVRKGHIIASKYAERGQAGFITQRDMALTQFGFMGYVALRPDKLGVQINRKDMEAFIHFWRVIGHMIGIHESYNLCTDSYRTTRLRLEAMLSNIFRPYLEETTDDFMIMAHALIDGLWCYNPMLDTNSFVYFTKWLSYCKNYVYYESDLRALDMNHEESKKILNSLNWYTRFVLYLQITAHTYLLNFASFRWYFNGQLAVSKHIIYWFPFLAFYKFGIKNSYVRILKGFK